jgi:predicted alpha-1,2-mannosidase
LALPPACPAAEPTPLEAAQPIVGTATFGHTYPGATVPFGMVQLSPDTGLTGWEHCSGYHYEDKAILGFSHNHLSGTGCPDLGDIRITPLGPTAPPQNKEGYLCPFSHKDEAARPGYYSVVLQNPKVKVELTATAHAGFHKYNFSGSQPVSLNFDLFRGIANDPVGDTLDGVVAVKNRELSGYRRSKGWAADKTCYFVAEFSRPFDSVGITVDDKPFDFGSRTSPAAIPSRRKFEGSEEMAVKGVRVTAGVGFTNPKEPILVKVGISGVSVEAARKNLAAEIPAWDFQGTVAAAAASWNNMLGRVEIEAIDPATRQVFYTALYHAAMAPTLYNDADGSYRGLDHKVHKVEGFQNYCTFSLWDTFRAEHALLTIVQPQRVDDFIGTMLAHYRQFGQHALPVWSLAGNETWCMIGNHAVPVISEAYAKGFRRYDVEAVYQAARDALMQDRNLMREYRAKGYVPSSNDTTTPRGEQHQSVSRTLEYAYDDWCLGRLAQLLGKTDDAKLFLTRSENFRNVFDPGVGFMRGKLPDGTWREPFSAYQLFWADYTEATAWQYSFFVPQNVPALVGLMGGDRAFADKIDKMFTDTSPIVSAETPDITGLIGQYVQGNEPDHHAAYLYNYAGASWKTQARIRQVMTSLYFNAPDGLCGNDDCGQMSAWYVLGALGFYPVNPTSCVYVIGSPLVRKATIHLDSRYHKGRTFTIIAKDNSSQNMYVQSATLNGKPLTRSWFSHAELAAGGELVLNMGPKPNKAWGQRPEDRPPVVAP